MSNLELRQRIPTLLDLYKFVTENRRFYLPKWKKGKEKQKCINENYLMGILNEQTFTISKDKIKKPVEVTRSCTKLELLKILEELADKPLNFECGFEPDKKWLLKVIFSLNPNHRIFRPVEKIVTRTLPKE